MPEQLEVAKRFGVGGYPLLIVFRHGKQYNFTGERNEEGELVMVVTTTCHTIALKFIGRIIMYCVHKLNNVIISVANFESLVPVILY